MRYAAHILSSSDCLKHDGHVHAAWIHHLCWDIHDGICSHPLLKRLQPTKRGLSWGLISHTLLACLQVSLLDPVSYPGAIKAFAKEVCRNDLLNFGRLHFFFPDSRLALDLNTDKTLKVPVSDCCHSL